MPERYPADGDGCVEQHFENARLPYLPRYGFGLSVNSKVMRKRIRFLITFVVTLL